MGEAKRPLDAWEVRKAATTANGSDDSHIETAEDAIALQFSDLHGKDLRYVAAWGRWMRWDGARWVHDSTLWVFDQVRPLCRGIASALNSAKAQRELRSAKTVAAVERLARADRRHAATVEQWDADPWLLNTPRGVVDLRTGDLLPHDPGRHITKVAAITPFGDCPTWLRFLGDITRNDTALQAYLQRAAGYALTGSIREHAMFFAYGTGANGKGTFLNTITAIMGDYAIVANAETFTAQTGSRHLTELARLQGARLVVAQETEEGRALAEARIKAITGGDPITANFMRQDHFTFNPQFKLFLAGNHKPALRNVDVAIRRRLNMIPFDVQIEIEKRDPDLFEKLKAEWAGILQWMVEGCIAWQRERLNPPSAVLSATEDYFEAEDSFGQWVTECCTTAMHTEGDGAALFKAWSAWARGAGEEPGSRKKFSALCASRGYESRRGTGGKVMIEGINLIYRAARTEPQADRD